MFTITDSIQDIEKKILKALAEDYNNALRIAIPKMIVRLRKETKPFFVDSEFYRSLSGGLLEAHFGFPKDGQERISVIVDAVLNAMFVGYTLASSRFHPTITVSILGEGLKEVFALSEGILTVDNDGQMLPWFEWWATRSGDIIIKNYEIELGSFSSSRSGKAIMQFEEGGIWMVPNAHQGTIGDNDLTRALFNNLDAYLGMISTVVREELERAI